jgi:DNA-binding CsgD family transcriptional regulator
MLTASRSSEFESAVAEAAPPHSPPGGQDAAGDQSFSWRVRELRAALAAEYVLLHFAPRGGNTQTVAPIEIASEPQPHSLQELCSALRNHARHGAPFEPCDCATVPLAARNRVHTERDSSVIAGLIASQVASVARVPSLHTASDFGATRRRSEFSVAAGLISHGPRVAAWLAVVRTKPFDSSARRTLEHWFSELSPACWQHAAPQQARPQALLLDAVLEHFNEPALIMSNTGSLEHWNHAAAAWIDCQHSARPLPNLWETLRAGAEPEGFSTTRVPYGAAHHWLLRKSAPENPLASAMLRARQSWGLSQVQGKVLQLVAAGHANKEIAALMGRAEVTVERYLTHLFKASGTGSRAELISKLYTLR